MLYKKQLVSHSQCMYDLESEWPAHNQGKTLGWLGREKTHCYYKTKRVKYWKSLIIN